MVEAKDSVRRFRNAFWMLLGAVFFFRLWFITTLPLSGDEAYHWEWSRHPAFGYYDHPGLTAYLIRLSTLMLGRSTEFTVRLPALLLLTATAVVWYLLARFVVRTRQGSAAEEERAGFMAGLLALAAPIFAFFSLYISTDPPLILFWSLSLYLLCRALHAGGWGGWLAAGFAVGLAVMSKFLAFLLIFSALTFILVSKPDRRWLRRPPAYGAALVALLVVSPFLWWNATHGWATFMFNFVYRQAGSGFAPKFAPEFVLGQAVALSPLVFALALAATWTAVRSRREEGGRTSLLLALSTLVPLAYFLYVSLKRRVGLHWPAASWSGALVCLACAWACAEPPRRRRWNRWMGAALGVCVLITVSMHLLVHIPPDWIRGEWRYGLSPNRINTRLQSERFGWHELGQRVQDARDEMLAAQAARNAGERGVFVVGSEYGLTADVAFYTPRQMETHLWAPKKIHGENYRFWDHFEEFKGMDALYVTKRESTASNEIPHLRDHFLEVDPPERFPVVINGREVRSFFLVRCRGFDGLPPDSGS